MKTNPMSISGKAVFTIDNKDLDQLFLDHFGDEVDYKDVDGYQYYVLDWEDYERFQDYAFSNGYDLEDIYLAENKKMKTKKINLIEFKKLVRYLVIKETKDVGDYNKKKSTADKLKAEVKSLIADGTGKKVIRNIILKKYKKDFSESWINWILDKLLK